MTTVPVPCPEPGCESIVHVPKSLYDDHDALIGLECPHGHRFDYEKLVCPRCGSPAVPAEYRPRQAWFGDRIPDQTPEFYPATCTSRDCDWEGPKS
jgi:NAD-dependent SIR2 family protein deacetylase